MAINSKNKYKPAPPDDDDTDQELDTNNPDEDEDDQSDDDDSDQQASEEEPTPPSPDDDDGGGQPPDEEGSTPSMAAEAPMSGAANSLAARVQNAPPPTPAATPSGPSTPATPPASLEQSLKKTGNSLLDTLEYSPSAAGPGKKDIAPILRDMKRVEASDQFRTQAPPDSRASLKEAIDKAQASYKEQTDKNDWYEVAQILGRAVTQFAAARGASKGVNLAGLNMGPQIDYEARNRRALGEKEQAVSNAKTLDTEGRQSVEDENKQKLTDYARLHGLQVEELTAAEKGAALEERGQEVTTKVSNRPPPRTSSGPKDTSLMDSVRAQSTFDKEENTLDSKVKAYDQVASSVEALKYGNPDEAKAARDKGEKAAKLAGVDFDDVARQYDANEPTKPGTLNKWSGGVLSTTNPDPDKAHATLLAIMGPMGLKDKIDTLADMKKQHAQILDQIRNKGKTAEAPSAQPGNTSPGGGPSATSGTPSTGPSNPPPAGNTPPAGNPPAAAGNAPAPTGTPVPPGMIRVISPKGQSGFIPQGQLDAALQAGYTQAK